MKFPRPLSRRRSRTLVLLVLLPFAALPTLRAQQPSAPPVDSAAVLATLKELKTKQTTVVAKEKGQVLDLIRAAMADPVKTYEQAVLAVEIQGKGGNEGTKMMEWRKQNSDLLRDKAFANALRLQLAYISLTWQRYLGFKVKDLLPALYDYTGQVVANYDALWSLDVVKKSLSDSVFVSYFQIGPYINNLENWESQPFNVDGIFQKTILPELRQNKDPRVLAYWDSKLTSEAGRVDRNSNGLAVNKFNNVRRPTLLWNRAEDEFLLGDVNRAVADMLAIVKAHPDHPDFDKWVARLTDIVNPPKGEVIMHDGPAVSSPAPTATPAPK